MKDSIASEGFNQYGHNPSLQFETTTGKQAPIQKKNKTSLQFKQKQQGNVIQQKEDPISKFHALKASKEGTTIQKKKNEEGELQLKKEEERERPVQKKEPNEKIQGKEIASAHPDNTGLPDNLKAGVESLSGYSMDHVKVHYNSDKPAQLQAHAFAQGSDIHIAPGQEKHLPHEAWHVVQQAEGRVKPTMQMKNKVNINDDAGLENEADVMGKKALSLGVQLNSDQQLPTDSELKFIQENKTSSVPSHISAIQRTAVSKEPPKLKSNLLPCGHESSGVLQRMITEEPADTDDIEVLEKYVFGTPINSKGQTFERAVRGSEKGAMLFEGLLVSLNNKDAVSALQKIRHIIEVVNKFEAKEPNHPNQVWKGSDSEKWAKEHDAPYSISKTPESIDIADKARKIILQLIGKEKFMLGVLVLPDGQLIIALSGSRGELLHIISEALMKEKFRLLGDQVYDVRSISYEDNKTYRKAAKEERKKHQHFAEEEDGKIVRERVSDKDDLGSYPATCAAAVALSVAKSVSPESFEGSGIMGLTEVFVSKNEHSEVLIYNKHTGDGERFTMKSKDVPSCHVCQMQLEQVAKEVVALEHKGILASLEQGMVKTKEELVKMEKGLEGLKSKGTKEEYIASGKDELESLLQETKVIQNDIVLQLKKASKEFAKYESEMKSITLEIEKNEKQILKLTAKSKDLKWEIDEKTRIVEMVAQLEREIEKLQKKVTLLESDEKELTSLSSIWNMFSLYSGWYKKVSDLQKTKEFKGTSNNDMQNELSKKIVKEKATLGEKQTEVKDYSSEKLKETRDELIEERKNVNIEKSKHEAERKPLRNKKEKLEPKLEESETEVQRKEIELNESIARMKDLQAKFDEASEAAQSLKETKRLIKKSETDLFRLKRDLNRLEMTHSVYSQK